MTIFIGIITILAIYFKFLGKKLWFDIFQYREQDHKLFRLMDHDHFDSFCDEFYKTSHPENLTYYQGLSLLLFAISLPHGLKYIHFLLKKNNFDINQYQKNNLSPLIFSIRMNRFFDELLAYNPNLDSCLTL